MGQGKKREKEKSVGRFQTVRPTHDRSKERNLRKKQIRQAEERKRNENARINQ